jgi:hypothetical protein
VAIGGYVLTGALDSVRHQVLHDRDRANKVFKWRAPITKVPLSAIGVWPLPADRASDPRFAE